MANKNYSLDFFGDEVGAYSYQSMPDPKAPL